MKKVFSFALAAIAALGVSMSAASTVSNVSQDNKEVKEKKEVKQKKGFGKAHRGYNPFEGINLTDQQKSQLKEVWKSFRKAPRLANCCQVPDAECCKGKGQKCCWEMTAEQAKQRAQENLAKIKGILTPEQYGQYLENAALSQFLHKPDGRRANGKQNGMKPRGGEHKDMKKGEAPKGNKPQADK